MSRPIAYNKPGAAINGSITNEDAVISYVVDGRGNDYYNNYESCLWVPSADGAAPIVFVTDTFTRGYEGDPNLAVPLFFACAGTSSAAIIYTANRLPGSPGNYSNANTAIDELNRTYGYFILESNDPFQGINANNLSLSVDASKMTSYPQTANNWYDLSGTGNTVALTNGPVWNSGGWFNFDGTDDYGINSSTSLNITGNVTMNAWVRNNGTGTSVGNYMSKAQNNGYRMRRNGGSGSPFWIYSNGNTVNGGAINDNIWYMVTGVFSSTGLRAYINSTLVASNSTPYSPAALTLDSLYIGAYTNGAEQFGGDIMNAQVYASALTEAQIKQNYFGSPIVTDGLVFAVDANNIVSYPKSGTSAYNLTGSNTLTLLNGLGYQLGNGGYFLSDGTNDGLTTPDASNLDLNNFTLEGWVWWNEHKNFGSLFVKGPGGSGNLFNYCFFFYAATVVCGFGDGGAFYNVSISTPTTNTWHHIVGTYDGSNLRFYLNGVLTGTSAITATPNQNSDNLNVIQPDYPINGRVANGRIYNRALTAAEIQQNYQAEQYRFKDPQGIVTNGLTLWLDAGNLDSYPGTGTTWTDLSGNGNNGTLVNGVTYNQINGGILITDGIDDYVSLGSGAASIVQGRTALTIGIMFNMDATGTLKGLIGTLNYFCGGNLGLVASNATLEFYNDTAACYSIGLSSYVTTGKWIYAVGTYDGTTTRLYGIKDGTLTQTSGTGKSGNTNVFSSDFRVMGNQNPTIFTNGKGSVAFAYNRVLSETEIVQNYNYFKGRFGL